MSTRVAIYCRVSTEEQSKDGVSLGAQEERCRALAFAKDWTVSQVYVDAGASGKSLERPALQRLIADVPHRPWDVVVFWKLDRLSRRQRDILYLLEDVLTPANIGLQSATEPFDTTTPMGKAMLGMLAVFAQLERETIVERTKMGRAQSLQLGRWQGGRVPYGYQRSGKGQLIPDPVTAPIVRNLFTQAAQGLGPSDLARWLNSEKVPAPMGDIWWDRVVEKLLKNPVYRGMVGRAHPQPGHHEALVDAVHWEAVQHKFSMRELGPHGVRPDFLVDGLLRCHLCGEPLRGRYVRPGKRPATSYDDPVRRYRYYYLCAQRQRKGRTACAARHYHAPKIDAQVADQLKAWIVDPVALDTAIAHSFPATDVAPDAERVRQQAAIDQRVARWYDAFEQGAIDAATLRERIDQLRHQQAALEAASPPPVVSTGANWRAIARQVLDLARTWDSLSPVMRQRLCRIIFRGGTITEDGKVQLTLRDLSDDISEPEAQRLTPGHL